MAENPGIKEGDNIRGLTVLAISNNGAYLGQLLHGLVEIRRNHVSYYRWGESIYRNWKMYANP